jgi:cephalosporin hydroxylase
MNKEQIRNDYSIMKKIAEPISFGCGWMVDDIAHLVYSLVIFYKPDIVIQTGHLWGKSARLILEALSINELPLNLEIERPIRDAAFDEFVIKNTPKTKRGILVSIDPNSFGINETVFDFLKNKYPNFYFYKMGSREYFGQNITPLLSEYTEKGKTILGVIDGDHTAEGCVRDLEFMNILRTQIIVVDDTLWIPHIDKICKHFTEIHPYTYANFPLYNGIGVLVRNE